MRWLLVLLCACQSFGQMMGRNETPWAHTTPPPGELVDPLAGKCFIPTYSDDYYNFTVGQPSGWKLDFSTGALMVLKDDTSQTGAMFYPVRIKTAVPPEQLAQFAANGLGNLVKNGGGTFELVDKTSDGRIATGLMLATIDGVRVRGPLQVIAYPGFMMLKAYWAPVAELDREEPTLKQVVACWGRKTLITRKEPVAPQGGPKTSVGMPSKPMSAGTGAPAKPLQPYQDRFFSLQVPAGWKMANETANGIDMLSADGHVGFGFGYFLNPINVTADGIVMQSLRAYYPQFRVLQSGFPPAPAGWQIAAAEFEGTDHAGKPVHGFLRVAMTAQVVLSHLMVTPPNEWDAEKATLIAIASTVQIQPAAVQQVNANIAAQLRSYPPPARASDGHDGSHPDRRYLNDWASQDRNSQNWSDAMLEQERVHSGDGEHYVVPTNAWNATGPDGPGYYRPTPGGGVERLEAD